MRIGAAFVALAVAAGSGPAAAQSRAERPGGAPPGAGEAHVRGVVTRLQGDTLEVETGPGRTAEVRLPADAKVATKDVCVGLRSHAVSGSSGDGWVFRRPMSC